MRTGAEFEEALKKWRSYWPLIKEMGPTILRFPGGLDANRYEWKKAIGPWDSRGGVARSPIIGTDEFLQFVEYLNAEAIIAVKI